MTTDSAETWVVGHDGSTGAAHATAWAVVEAAGRNASITLLRTWQIPALDFPFPVGSIDEFAPTQACEDFDEIAAWASESGVSVSQRIIRGAPAATLLETSTGGSLLVVGSRGLGGFRRLLLGSVSSQCAAHAVVPTVVVPAATAIDRPIARIVVGLDGSQRSQRALAWAADFAPDGCHITVVGAWMPWASGFGAAAKHDPRDLEHARDSFNALLDALETDAGPTTFDRRFAFADPATTLLDEAVRADLLVVGQRGHASLSAAILGSVSTHVLHHSQTPVAVVPDDNS